MSAEVNVFSEEPVNCTATQVKEKLDGSNDEDAKTREPSVQRNTLHNDAVKKTPEPEPCSCVYQHAREIAERKKEILENPPCPCLLNSRRKWETCPCLTKRKYIRIVLYFLHSWDICTCMYERNTVLESSGATHTGSGERPP